MKLSQANAQIEEIGRCPVAAEKTGLMRELVTQFKGENDRKPLRGLLTTKLLNDVDKAFKETYGIKTWCAGVDTGINEVAYASYTSKVVEIFRWHCRNRLEEVDGEPLTDGEKLVLETLPAKAKVWMTFHPHLLLADHKRMPLLTGSVMRSIVNGLSRMVPTLSEVSQVVLQLLGVVNILGATCPERRWRSFQPSGMNIPEGES